MAYTKQTWENGKTPLDAEHMNHIEEGISNIELTPGPKGDTGKGVKSIALTKDGSGAITDGTVTCDDESTGPTTVTTSEG